VCKRSKWPKHLTYSDTGSVIPPYNTGQAGVTAHIEFQYEFETYSATFVEKAYSIEDGERDIPGKCLEVARTLYLLSRWLLLTDRPGDNFGKHRSIHCLGEWTLSLFGFLLGLKGPDPYVSTEAAAWR
jgi:hypothetical protein